MPHFPSWFPVLEHGLAVVGYLSLCFVGWYLLAAFNYGMNSGQLGRHPLLFPFECFAEELICYLPRGKQHRINFIAERIGDGDGMMFSLDSGKSWNHQEIREKGNYEEVFYGMIGSQLSFWFRNFFTFFASPLIVALNVALFSVLGILGGLVWIGSSAIKPFRKSVATRT